MDKQAYSKDFQLTYTRHPTVGLPSKVTRKFKERADRDAAYERLLEDPTVTDLQVVNPE